MSESIKVSDNYFRKVKVERCVDGDTVDVLKDMGERVWKRDRYRLLGIDTPERGKPGYYEATEYLEMIILREEDSEGFIMMRTMKHGKFRWLAELYGPESGVNLNQEMIDAGHAVPYDGGKK